MSANGLLGEAQGDCICADRPGMAFLFLDALKQENWDLSVARQNLEEQLSDSFASFKKAEGEKARLTKDLSKARETIDGQRVQIDAHLAELEELRTLRETETAMARRDKAGMQRDFSDLQTELQQFKLQQLGKLSLNRSLSSSMLSGNSSLDEDANKDEDQGPDSLAARRKAALAAELPPSPSGSTYSEDASISAGSPLSGRLVRDQEMRDLRAKLTMAQKKAGKEAAEKRRQREQNAELRRLLAQAGVDAPVIADVESSDDDGDDDDEHWIDEPNTSPSAKRLAKMRMPKSSTRPSMASRMGLSPRAAGAAAGAELDEDDAPEEFEDASADADTIAAGSEEHTSIDDRSSPRNSLDGGIDPAFADVMKADFATPARERKGRKAAVRNQKTVAAGSPLARGSFGPEEGETDSGEESPPERRPEQRPSGRRSAAAAARPQSTIIEPTALGAELEGLSGPDEEELHSQGLHTAEDGFEPSMQTVRPETADADMQTEPEPEPVPAVVEPAREMTETVMMTEPEPDVLSPALAERDNAHAVALSEVHKRHADALADKEREHQAMLAEKESAHSTALAAALADKAKTHEAALGEARSRHTRALAEQVAQGSAALVAAEAAHKALLAERHSAYETDVALRDAVHGSALAQKDQEHSKALQHMEATHAAFVAQRDQAYQAALAEKDVALRNSQAEVDQLRRQLDELRSLLEASKQDLATSKAAHDASVQQLASAQAEAERAAAAAKEQSTAMAQAQAQAQAQAEQQKESQKVAHVDSAVQAGSGTESAVKAPALGAGAALAGAAGAAVLTKDGNSTAHAESDVDRFEDAVSHMSPTASSFAMTPSVTQSTLANRTAQPEESDEEDGDDTQSVIASRVNDARRRASSTSSSDNSPKTPKDEIAQPGIRKVVLADLKDMSCQTDDELWLSHQAAAAQQAAIGREQAQPPRPLSSLTVSTRDGTAPTDSMVGPGGIMILGGHRSSRPRDSVSTFGGNREGSLRNESPAPTMYTVGAVTGQGHNPSRRPSVESTWSHHADRNAEVPPVPPLPDKTKPPTMAVPPPPSMPPPPGLPVKRSQPPQTLQIPPRPTSPPPADLVHRAQRSTLLQVPANGGERSVSRQSGGSVAPPSSFVPSAASGSVRQHGSLNSMRTRTLSSEGASGVSQFGGLAPPAGDGYAASAGAGTGRQSISSRRSAKGKQRQSSAASFASDVTSELSRRLSIASSRASDILADRTSAENNAGTRGPATRGAGVMGASESTDPSVIHAITQTMIGEYLYKYTRRTMGRAGHSDKRHRRYFWVHPYTKMLYWTMSDPGGAAVTEGTSKSACIEDVRVVEDSNPNPPGLYHLSILVKTAAREMKVTAPNKDRHDTWLSALGYLVNRSQPANPAANGAAGAGAAGTTDQENGATARKPRNRSKTTGTVKSRLLSPARSLRSRRSVESFGAGIDSTPRPRGASVGGASTLYASVNKRRDIPAREYLAQQEQEELLRSPTGSTRMRGGSNAGGGGGGNDVFTSQLDADDSYDGLGDISGMSFADPRLKTAEEMLEEDEEEGFEGLDVS